MGRKGNGEKGNIWVAFYLYLNCSEFSTLSLLLWVRPRSVYWGMALWLLLSHLSELPRSVQVLKTSWVSQGRCHGSLPAPSSSSLSFSVSGRMRSKNMPPRWLCNPGQAVSPLCGLVATLVKGDHTVELSLANEQAVGISVCPLWHPLPRTADAICGHQSRPWSSQEDAARPSSVLRAPGGCEEGWRSLWGTDRAEELCSLLQEAHQPTLGEVATRAHPVLIRWQGVIRDCRLLKHIGGNIL